MNISLREHTEHDIGEILELFTRAFRQEQSEEWFRWKYHRSPWGSKGYVALHEKKIIAFYGGIRLRFHFNREPLWAYQFCDVMSHPEYRGRRVGKTPFIVQLGELFYRENPMDFAFGFPSLRHSRLQSLRLGGEGYRPVQMYGKKNLRHHPALWRFAAREGREFFESAELQRVQSQSRENSPASYGSGTLQLVKNEEYLRWRYCEHPSAEYGFLVFTRMHRIKGSVLYAVKDGRLDVLEIFLRKEKDFRQILIALETYAIKKLHAEGIRLWLHPGEHLHACMDALGYGKEEGIPLAFRPVSTAGGITADIFYSKYFYRMGDYDAA